MVSIITPCYNAESFIKDTIISVLNQTYQDWEMLIVDDCSTDNSADIIKEFQKIEKRIRYFRTPAPSGSPAAPRNIGVANAKGDYIAFLDSDDLWLPDKLEKQVKFMDTNNHVVSYSFYEKMDWQGNRAGRIVRGFSKTTYHTLLKFTSMAFLTMMFRREVIGSTRFKNVPQEDYNFYMDVLKKGYTAYNLGEVTAVYRESNNSRSANKMDMFKGHWYVLRQLQGVNTPAALFYMLTYAFHGLSKYLK